MKFIFGFGIGVALGVIFAPASGENTRRNLYQHAREYAKVPQQKVADAIEANKEKVGEIGARLGREAAQSAIEDVTEKLRGQEKTA